MTSRDIISRLYTKEEAGKLLRRATELQVLYSAGKERTVTYEDVVRIGAEVGLDPHFVKTAAFEFAADRYQEERHVFGAPTSTLVEHTFTGRMTPERWEEMLREIRNAFACSGTTFWNGTSSVWMHPLDLARVTTSSEERRTRVGIEYKYHWPVSLLFFMIAMWGLGGAGAIARSMSWPPLVELVIALGSLTGLLVALRVLIARWVRQHRRKLIRLLHRLGEIVSASGS